MKKLGNFIFQLILLKQQEQLLIFVIIVNLYFISDLNHDNITSLIEVSVCKVLKKKFQKTSI